MNVSGELTLTDVRKDFGKTQIIRGVDLQIRAGERHAIIGPNGAGKTTLFNLICGRLRPTAGRINLDQSDITGLEPYDIYRRGLSRSFQVSNIFPALSVFDNLRSATLWSLGYRYVWWRSLDGLTDVSERATTILEKVGLTAKRNELAGELSYAEQRALEIGLAISGNSTVVMLDEPTAGMSKAETEHMIGIIREVTKDHTLVMIEHDMSVVFTLAERISVLVYGQVIATGLPQEVRSNPEVQRAYLGVEVQ